MKPENVDRSIVTAFLGLHPRNLPKSLLQENPIRSANDFDPNVYFTVLTHLGITPGYTLDYAYYFDGNGGHPCLYFRKAGEKQLGSFAEYTVWQKKNDLLSFMVTDDTPDGFFQLIVFRRLAGQFYLYWHANYNDTRILTTAEDIEAIISSVSRDGFGTEFTEEQISALRTVNACPTVELSVNQASVTYCLFSRWGGLTRLRESYHRLPPHLMFSQQVLSRVEYLCNVDF